MRRREILHGKSVYLFGGKKKIERKNIDILRSQDQDSEMQAI